MPVPAEQTEELRLDYDQTTELLRTLTDVRFKLIAFVPTISGIALGLLTHGHTTAELLAVGSLGLVATLGIVVYELRNTQVYDYALARAQELERGLGLVSIADPSERGGLYSEIPRRDRRLFGLAAAGHDRGLALVYSAAIGGWGYLVAWGALNALDISGAQKIGGLVGAATGLLVLVEFMRVDGRPKGTAARRSTVSSRERADSQAR